MSKLSYEQIQNLADIIRSRGKVTLGCDGYRISLFVDELHRYRPSRADDVVYVYIDGMINVAWCNYRCDQSRFYMPLVLNDHQTLYQPYFYCARGALEHINAAADNVRLLVSENNFRAVK